jgi:hypothetical protein
VGQAATRLVLNRTHLKDDDGLRSDPLTKYREHHRSSDESRKTSNVLRVSKMGGDEKVKGKNQVGVTPLG